MVPDGVANPAFVNMFNARYYLEQADNNINLAQLILDSTNPMKNKL
jgi:hypothetical protein